MNRRRSAAPPLLSTPTRTFSSPTSLQIHTPGTPNIPFFLSNRAVSTGSRPAGVLGVTAPTPTTISTGIHSGCSSPPRTLSSDVYDSSGAMSDPCLSPGNEIWDSTADLELDGVIRLRAQRSRETVKAGANHQRANMLAFANADTNSSGATDPDCSIGSSFDQPRMVRYRRRMSTRRPSQEEVRSDCDLVLVGAPANVALGIFKIISDAMVAQKWSERHAGSWRLLWRDGPVLYAHKETGFSVLPTESKSESRVYLQWHLSDGTTVEGPPTALTMAVIPICEPIGTASARSRIQASRGSVRAELRWKHKTVSHPIIPSMLREIPLEWLFFAHRDVIEPLQPQQPVELGAAAVFEQQNSHRSLRTFAWILFSCLLLALGSCLYLLKLKLKQKNPFHSISSSHRALTQKDLKAFAALSNHSLSTAVSPVLSKSSMAAMALTPLALLAAPAHLWQAVGRGLAYLVSDNRAPTSFDQNLQRPARRPR